MEMRNPKLFRENLWERVSVGTKRKALVPISTAKKKKKTKKAETAMTKVEPLNRTDVEESQFEITELKEDIKGLRTQW